MATTPTFTATNARPVDLSTTHITPSVTGDDCHDLNKVVGGLVQKIFLQPLSSTGGTVTFTDDTGAGYNRDDITDTIVTALVTPTDSATNATASAMLEQMTRHSRADHNLPVDQLLLSQALGTTGLPSTLGSAIVRYDVGTDVTPAATDYLALVNNPGTRNYDRGVEALTVFYASLASLYTPDAHAVSFSDAGEFDTFTANVKNFAETLVNAGKADQSVLTKASDLTAMSLSDEIVTGIKLRGDDQDTTEDYSFARIITYVAHDMVSEAHSDANTDDRAPNMDLMPFGLTELINPSSLLFINMENHARKPVSEIIAAWLDMVASTQSPINMVSLNKLSKINAVSANVSKMSNAFAVAAQRRVKRKADARRSANESDFSSAPALPADAARDIMAKLNSMANQNRSHNVKLTKRKTYNRPSRRTRPSGMVQGPGRIKRKTYYPDIHFYADTSGSMSVEDYQDTLILVAMMATKLKCDVYFSSFSDVLSNEVLLPTKGRSPTQIQKIIKAIPKVSGGTDFQQIWDNVNRLESNKKRLSIISTDFEYHPRAYPKIDHPANAVYVPAFNRKNPSSWGWVKHAAANFINAMRPHDPMVDTKILGMR